MPNGLTIILALKIAVTAVTLLLIYSLVVLAQGKVRLHGKINVVFFALTMAAVLLFEGLIRFGPWIESGWSATAGWEPHHHTALSIHLCFVLPLMAVLPAMLITGKRRLRRWHLRLAFVFSVLWMGMFVTGFYLPHRLP